MRTLTMRATAWRCVLCTGKARQCSIVRTTELTAQAVDKYVYQVIDIANGIGANSLSELSPNRNLQIFVALKVGRAAAGLDRVCETLDSPLHNLHIKGIEITPQREGIVAPLARHHVSGI